jgi:ribosomal-protein-alanine N-acetyltransferase
MQSERMILKKITANDIKDVNKIYSNLELTKYFVSGPDSDMIESKNRVERIELHWNEYGFGDFLLFDKSTDELFGYGGLHYKAKGGKINISYVILEEAQGKGLGYEISMKLIEYGFKTLELPEIVAEIDPDNTMSKKLIEKCGFKFNRMMKWKGHEREEYVMSISDFVE